MGVEGWGGWGTCRRACNLPCSALRSACLKLARPKHAPSPRVVLPVPPGTAEYYEKVTSTRKYEDRLATIETVRQAGISVCAGGIIGLGEGKLDRVGLLHQVGRVAAGWLAGGCLKVAGEAGRCLDGGAARGPFFSPG